MGQEEHAGGARGNIGGRQVGSRRWWDGDGNAQVGGWPRAETGDAGLDTGDAQVGRGPHAVAKLGNILAEEKSYRYIKQMSESKDAVIPDRGWNPTTS